MNPLVNGVAYSWAQITVNILGRALVGITAVSYSEEQEMENNYGAGNRPVSRGYGRITSEASITLDMTEIEALQQLVPSGRLQDIPEFDVVVAYVPQTGGTVTHTIQKCRFMNNAREAEEGAMNMTTELNLIVGQIKWTS